MTLNAERIHAFIRKLQFAMTLVRRSISTARLPYKAEVLVTWRCQARCRMCNIWKRGPENELSLEEWRSFFQHNSYFQWLTLSGGEPFLRNDIAEMVRLALEFCPKLFCVNMPTNGLSPEIVKKRVGEILALNVPEFVLAVSIDGPEEIHDKSRGIPGAWRRSMDVLQWAKQLEKEHPGKFTVVLEHTLLPDSYGRFAEMLREVKGKVPEIKASDFMVTIGGVSEHYYGNTDNQSLRERMENHQAIEKALLEIIAMRREELKWSLLFFFSQYFLKKTISYVRGDLPPLRCRAARSSIFIDPCGLIYPCHTYDRPLGSLRDHDYSLEKLFAANNMNQLRADIDELKCGGCWVPCDSSPLLAEKFMNPLWAWRILKSGWMR